MNYERILTRLYNTPLFLDSSKIDIITSGVTVPLLLGQSPASGVATAKENDTSGTENVAVINVFGSLVSKSAGFSESGLTSYSSMKAQTLSAIEAGASKLIFYVGSHGGEAGGLFAFTDFIASLPETYGVETVGFTDDYATSAAYAILSATQTVTATSSSIIGSIGAVMALVDQTKKDEKEGLTYHILRSKEEKALGNPHEIVTEEVLENHKSKLMALDEIFNSHVEKYRSNLKNSDIIAMKGNSFMAERALELGLIDQIVTSLDEVVSMETSNLTLTTGNSMTLEELKSENAKLKADLETSKLVATEACAQAIAGERTRCLALLNAGETLKISAEQVTKRISAGTSAEDSTDIFTAIAEATGNATAVETNTEVASTVQTVVTKTEAAFDLGDISATASDILAAAKGDK